MVTTIRAADTIYFGSRFLRVLFGVDHILWVAPMMDTAALITAVVFYRKKIDNREH